ncbi:WAS/WASL-interacting protein family member 3-like isoform X1 [Macrosteles quadrilineatus]|uniref:WAS/WASL-interacting protein family member 3-like isoform X1 n=2 Tax=Macrosteles quadrilineatus TaxID=74068 RepID=UPI0023E2B78E|nr:WAS/WASL-interacting protein family member 3-like isoform X1 [Macrosteles quadrilineatus]
MTAYDHGLALKLWNYNQMSKNLQSDTDDGASAMISSGVVVEGHGLHYPASHMSFGSIPPVPEFLRPLPKPAPLVARYNQNRPVSLVQHKEDEDNTTFPSSIYNSRLFPPPPPFSHYPGLQGPYGSLYPAHYTPFRERHLPPNPNPNPPLSPLEAYPGPQSPRYSHSPPETQVKGQNLTKDKKFKVPSGKEGSLKHRILTRPDTKRRRPQLPSVPEGVATNNNVPSPSFNKGSLIQLANGELRKVEDMRTEDFVSSAERSPALRLDPSTVVRIDTSPSNKGYNLLTLSYGENRNQVEFESAVGHPYFVYGQGWASCDPDKTLTLYGLRCHQLQVGDICISLSPRATPASDSPGSQGKKRRWSAPDQFCSKKTKE